jgi:hypothetical protein
MNCSSNAGNNNNAATLSKAEALKLFLSIDRELIREAQKNKKSSVEVSELDEVVTQVLRSDINDNEVSDFSTGNKVLILPGDVTAKASALANELVKKNASVAANVVGAPVKAKVEEAMKALRGENSKSFVYAFIPSNSPTLKENPEVKRKRDIQVKAIKDVSDEIGFPQEYVMKHIRNAMVEHFKTNPEQVLHDVSSNKISGLGATGSGISAQDISSLLSSGAALVNAFKPSSTPAAPDWASPNYNAGIPANTNVTNDPSYDKTGDSLMEFIKSPLGIVVGVVVGGGAAYAIFR